MQWLGEIPVDDLFGMQVLQCIDQFGGHPLGNVVVEPADL